MGHTIYAELSAGRPGMLGAVTSRAEAQAMRLAMIYALLDESRVIRIGHLRASLAVWNYCEASARYIFGSSLGDRLADDILAALLSAPKGMTRTELSDHLGRHRSAERIGQAPELLRSNGFVDRMTFRTDGRPAERWIALEDAN